MKILFVNQFFWPDSSATSQQLTDLATGLAERGHDVHVLCGEGGYAAEANGVAPPVTVHRVRSLRFVRGRVGRVLSYLSFYVRAAVRGLFMPRVDTVVSLTTPPLISLIGTAIKSLRGSQHFIWEQDVYPDVAIDLHYIRRGGLLDRITGLLADFSRRHADGILALGECMRQRLLRRGIPARQIYLTENWANGSAIQPMPRPGDPAELVVLYSGNLGLAHDVDTIAGAMRQLRDEANFRFLFVGGGGRRADLTEFCRAEGITRMEMRPYVDRDRLNEGLAAGDIGLVTQMDACTGSVVPSKVYGILAAGRPVLFVGPADATPALTIDRHSCGWHVRCGDVDGLTALLRHLAAHRDEVETAGRNARAALLQNYDLPLGIDRIASVLERAQSARDATQHTWQTDDLRRLSGKNALRERLASQPEVKL